MLALVFAGINSVSFLYKRYKPKLLKSTNRTKEC